MLCSPWWGRTPSTKRIERRRREERERRRQRIVATWLTVRYFKSWHINNYHETCQQCVKSKGGQRIMRTEEENSVCTEKFAKRRKRELEKNRWRWGGTIWQSPRWLMSEESGKIWRTMLPECICNEGQDKAHGWNNSCDSDTPHPSSNQGQKKRRSELGLRWNNI